MSNRAALITGLAGPTLEDRERGFLRAHRPAGLILFARNIIDHEQLRRLVGTAREAIGGDDALVLIDQEGGRVQRLRPPLARALPPAAAYAALYGYDRERALRGAFLAARLLAEDLNSFGIDTDCAPVLDLRIAGAHEIIGDRAYGATPEEVATLGRAVAEGLMAGGVVPVIKHIPGHGRATADSHLALPVVTTARAELEATDFAPFRRLADMPAAMTAHVVFSAIDAREPASTSAIVTADIIRRHIGFDGLLMSDDLGMKALTGSMRQRAEAVIRAGSDVALHCSGDFGEMESAVAGVPWLGGDAARRFDKALEVKRRRVAFDAAEAEEALADVVGHFVNRTESV